MKFANKRIEVGLKAGNKTIHNKPAAQRPRQRWNKRRLEEDRRGDEFLMREPSGGWRGELFSNVAHRARSNPRSTSNVSSTYVTMRLSFESQLEIPGFEILDFLGPMALLYEIVVSGGNKVAGILRGGIRKSSVRCFSFRWLRRDETSRVRAKGVVASFCIALALRRPEKTARDENYDYYDDDDNDDDDTFPFAALYRNSLFITVINIRTTFVVPSSKRDGRVRTGYPSSNFIFEFLARTMSDFQT
ncbi:hypothetical protein V1478_002488 [Vespula squamosa]|uniref:Uncharacterized protein n=1 Tax=Vespula squamosa TaxID=30214 RepID=A0ABD2BSP5_VESSQ